MIPNFWDSGHKDYGREYQDTLRRADAATHFEIIDSRNVTINNLASSRNRHLLDERRQIVSLREDYPRREF